jgi:acetyl-CoA carboxylase biotin carboxyl carrier protein
LTTSPSPTVEKADTHFIFEAPIVGTFYLTPKPDAEPFVKIGDPVGKGKVLCIIEAMKIFNQIESDVDGKIVRVLVENGQPVEYGQPLFEIQVNA